MNYIRDIKLKENNSYNMVIEIPKGTSSKYELVEPTFDKVQEVRKVFGIYPFYYGCFPQTLAGDRDPLDVILLTNKKYDILDIVEVEIIGVIKTIDNNEIDDKIVVTPVGEYFKSEKIENKYIKNVFKFLKKYKGKKSNTVIDSIFYNKDVAISLIKDSNKTFKMLNSINNTLTSF